MIQRKQTLFLLAALALLASLFFIDLSVFAGEQGVLALRFWELRDITDPDYTQHVFTFVPLASLVIISVVLVVLAIFLFKRRPLQMRLCGIGVGLQIGTAVMIFVLSRLVASDIEVEWHFHYACLLPLLSAVLTYLAYRGISDDEAIIRSLNRLR